VDETRDLICGEVEERHTQSYDHFSDPCLSVIAKTQVSLKAVQELLKLFQWLYVEAFGIVDDLVILPTEFETESVKAEFET
jgi:hypothetical protein